MAGAGYKLFNTGDVLTAAQVNTYLMEQTVMVFADAAARTTALSGVVSEGMISYLKDTNAVEVYDGSNWVSSDDPNAIQNTIVDAKGDLISASAADVPARLAVGNNGETLVADSSQSTGLRWGNNYGFTAGKNKLINGDFRINQRNFTSVTANDTYTFDRWASALSGGTVTYTPQTFTAGTAPVAGYEGTNFIRIVTSGQTSTNYAQILQKIEGVRTFAGQTVTLSFWAKAGSGTPLITAAITQLFGSGGSSAVGTNASGNQTLSTSWARYSFTFAIPSISGKTIGGASNALWVAILVSDGGGAGSTLNTVQNGTFDIWGVQLEAGSVATAFQTATGTLAGELAACQRYYYIVSSADGSYNFYAVGQATSSTVAKFALPFPVTMRIAPTSVVQTGNIGALNAGNTAINNGTLALDTTTNNRASLNMTGTSGLVAGNATVMLANNSTATSIAFSAEL